MLRDRFMPVVFVGTAIVLGAAGFAIAKSAPHVAVPMHLIDANGLGADVGTHLADLALGFIAGESAVDIHRDLRMFDAKRWVNFRSKNSPWPLRIHVCGGGSMCFKTIRTAASMVAN